MVFDSATRRYFVAALHDIYRMISIAGPMVLRAARSGGASSGRHGAARNLALRPLFQPVARQHRPEGMCVSAVCAYNTQTNKRSTPRYPTPSSAVTYRVCIRIILFIPFVWIMVQECLSGWVVVCGPPCPHPCGNPLPKLEPGGFRLQWPRHDIVCFNNSRSSAHLPSVMTVVLLSR